MTGCSVQLSNDPAVIPHWINASSNNLPCCSHLARGGGVWWCRKTGTRRRKATYHLQNDIKRREKKTCSRRGNVSLRGSLHNRPDESGSRSSDKYRTRRLIPKNLSEPKWMKQPVTKGHHMLTVLPDRHPPSRSHSAVRG